jgi:hypothetical protein
VAITDIELQNFGRDQRIAEIALSQAGMAGASGAGTAFGGKAPDNSRNPEEKMLIVNH